MKKRLTKEEWKELLDKINSGELNVTEGSKIFKVSRMQIYRKLKEKLVNVSIYGEERKGKSYSAIKIFKDFWRKLKNEN